MPARRRLVRALPARRPDRFHACAGSIREATYAQQLSKDPSGTQRFQQCCSKKTETAPGAEGSDPPVMQLRVTSSLTFTERIPMKLPKLLGAALFAAATSVSAADIVDTAVSAGQFKTLVQAVQAAGLVDTLKGEGPFTVFAPTDAAFAKLPAGAIEALLKDKQKLAEVLTYRSEEHTSE